MSQSEPITPRYGAIADRILNSAAGDDGAPAAAGPFGSGHYGADVDELPDGAVRASLGCGNPLAVADLRPGEIVLDLGSGGGIDVVLSARRVGPTGFAYGLDATVEMIVLARRNAVEAGVDNVEFVHGTIEAIPLADASVDVVISNCVLVLSSDKVATFGEIARVLRPGGRIGISDIVRSGRDVHSPPAADCAATAIDPVRYEDALREAGLARVSVDLTDDIGGGLSNAIVRARKPSVAVRPMRPGDWDAVAAIYVAGIATGNATFETSVPTWRHWDSTHLTDHRLVATAGDGTVVGWASLSPISDRCVDAGVAEDSVYVDPDHRGTGVGASLLDALVAGAERAGIWTIQTGIFPENLASVVAHRAVGFRIVGRRERIAVLDGVWRDTLLLERRSPRIT